MEEQNNHKGDDCVVYDRYGHKQGTIRGGKYVSDPWGHARGEIRETSFNNQYGNFIGRIEGNRIIDPWGHLKGTVRGTYVYDPWGGLQTKNYGNCDESKIGAAANLLGKI